MRESILREPSSNKQAKQKTKSVQSGRRGHFQKVCRTLGKNNDGDREETEIELQQEDEGPRHNNIVTSQ